MRKSLSFLLSAISLTSVCRSYFAEVNSEPVGTAGGFSENFEWSIDDEGVLTIRGEHRRRRKKHRSQFFFRMQKPFNRYYGRQR